VTEGGDRRPRVVLVHGAMDRAAAFAKAARHLRDLDVVRYDRRGYGRAVGEGTATSLDHLVEDLMDVIDGHPAAVVGHSLGAVVALAAANRHPGTVVSVGAFEPPMPWEPWWPNRTAGSAARAASTDSPAAAAEAFMRRMIGDERWDALPARTRQQRRDEGPALLADLGAIRTDEVPFDARALKVPVVVGYGSDTDERHRRAVLELARTVPGAELVVIAGAGHGAHYSHGIDFAGFVRRVVERGSEPDPSTGV
jgi:pimeloyl-ACP methyl ester carboxylesterase